MAIVNHRYYATVCPQRYSSMLSTPYVQLCRYIWWIRRGHRLSLHGNFNNCSVIHASEITASLHHNLVGLSNLLRASSILSLKSPMITYIYLFYPWNYNIYCSFKNIRGSMKMDQWNMHTSYVYLRWEGRTSILTINILLPLWYL
jgi:hypothetical protein